MKSQSIEDYIKTIYKLQEAHAGAAVSTSALSLALGITNASVTGMLKRLAASADARLVAYEPYSGVTLTLDGKKMALELIRHHRLIESYLSEKLGYTWDEVHAEAEKLEHVISEEMEERMASALGYPLTDPHGDPIPDREGNLEAQTYLPLTQLAEGQGAAIRRITGQSSELLRYLAEQGLTLSAEIKLISKAPFNGPVSISVGSRPGPALALGRDVAELILVEAQPELTLENTYERTH